MAVYGPMGAEEIYHYGIPRKSGRYPYGSGKEPYQDDPKKRRLNKDESAPKATSKRPETIWSKHRKAQAEAQTAHDRANQKTSKSLSAQKAKTMSDEELKRAIARMSLEQEYLSKVAASATTKKGKNFMKNFVEKTDNISKIIGNTSKTIAGAYAIYMSGKKFLELLEKQK